jgi:2'-5' RNA ligase
MGNEAPVSPREKRKRLFFALWPDAQVRQGFARIASRTLKRRGRTVPAENLHLTLAFLGAVTAERQHCMENLADNLAADAFDLVFIHLGHWPGPRVIWSGCEGTPEALLALVAGLRAGMLRCGLEPEIRPYRAHMTLARKASVAPAFGASHDPVEWRVRNFHLVESQTLSSGARYEIVRSWALARISHQAAPK